MESPLQKRINDLYREYGLSKPMGISVEDPSRPHFFLHRRFIDDQDLLIIFNTKRCRYQCNFCNLPSKSSIKPISSACILDQFEFVVNELKHSIGVLNRITVSNEGSVLDTDTFPQDALITIAQCTSELKAMRTIVLETRLEFVSTDYLNEIALANPKVHIDVLTGFETLDPKIRDKILVKREPIDVFINGLDILSTIPSSLTAYVLFKPSPYMTDTEALNEAENSIDFLKDKCKERNIPLTIRLNPMYAANGSKWFEMALQYKNFKPPRLSDVLELAERKRAEGVKLYIGLSTEGLDDPHCTYRAREDFTKDLLKRVIGFNYW
jgi:hypothetical protein